MKFKYYLPGLVFIGLIIMLILLILGFYLDNIKASEIKIEIENKSILEQEVINKVSEVKTFYNYSLENKRKIYNETRLIKSGGCCWEWAEYYGNYFKEKGYYTKQVIISTRNETNIKTHQFVVVSKNKTYCVIDQTKYWCRNFKK